MQSKMTKKIISYKDCNIIVRNWDNGYNSFEAQDENENTLWLTDIMYECDYLDACKDVIDKYLKN